MTDTPFCVESLSSDLVEGMINTPPRRLTEEELAGLWEIFVSINKTWKLFRTRDPEHPVYDASNLRSTWLEFVTLRAESEHRPSYVGEYENALAVIADMRRHDMEPHERLLFAGQAASNSRLGHAKKYVADEFMTVMLVASGFKEFGGRNYNGFIGGSRFNRATSICLPVEYPARRSP
jgi:hypothetical protein